MCMNGYRRHTTGGGVTLRWTSIETGISSGCLGLWLVGAFTLPLYLTFYDKNNFYITVINCQDSCETCFSSDGEWGRSYTLHGIL